MKARSTVVSGVLALVGLVAAYLTWQRPRESMKADAVQVFAATKQSLEAVHFEDGTRFIDVAKKGDGAGRLWVTMGFLPGKTPVFDAGVAVVALDGGADAGVDGGAPLLVTAKPPEPTPTREMHANDRASTLFERFMPFEATRALGTLPKEKLDELGLTGSERRLTVTVAGEVHRLIASKPVSGIIGSYLQHEKSGEVYLVQSSLLTELDPTSQLLVDRRLHTFKQAEFDAFAVTVDGKTAELVQTNADIPQTAKVARAATPDKPDELVKNWHDKIWNRLVVTEVLGKGELPKLGEPKVSLRIDYRSRGAEKGWLEIGFDKSQGTWARSENTASWVAVHQGTEEIVLEARRFMQP